MPELALKFLCAIVSIAPLGKMAKGELNGLWGGKWGWGKQDRFKISLFTALENGIYAGGRRKTHVVPLTH